MKFAFIPYRNDEDRISKFCIDIMLQRSNIYDVIMTFEFEGSVAQDCWFCSPSLVGRGNLLYISKYVNSIVNRFQKHNPVINHPSDLVQWLKGLNGCVGRIVYDQREDKHLPVLEVKSSIYHTYEAYIGNTGICRIIATNFNDAVKLAEKKIIKECENEIYQDWWDNDGMVKILDYIIAPSMPSILDLTTLVT